MKVYTALWLIHAIEPFVPVDDKEVMAARKTRVVPVEVESKPEEKDPS